MLLWPSKPNCRFKKKKQTLQSPSMRRKKETELHNVVFFHPSAFICQSSLDNPGQRSQAVTVLILFHLWFLAALLSKWFVWGIRDMQSIDVTRALLF